MDNLQLCNLVFCSTETYIQLSCGIKTCYFVVLQLNSICTALQQPAVLQHCKFFIAILQYCSLPTVVLQYCNLLYLAVLHLLQLTQSYFTVLELAILQYCILSLPMLQYCVLLLCSNATYLWLSCITAMYLWLSCSTATYYLAVLQLSFTLPLSYQYCNLQFWNLFFFLKKCNLVLAVLQYRNLAVAILQHCKLPFSSAATYP